MSKKNTKLLQKFISILACVVLLVISVIPVNNIYADDVTNNGENSQETSEGNTSETTGNTTGTNTNNEEGGDTTDPNNQDPQVTTTNEENNQSAPMKLMAPKAGGPLKAPVPGRPEDVEIILSNETSGEYTSGGDWEFQEEYLVTVNLAKMQQNHAYTLEIEVADGMFVSRYAFDKSLGTKSKSTLMRIGTEVGYSNDARGMFSANKIEFDETTYATKAIYTYTTDDVSAIPFTKDLGISPNTYLTYNGDEIKDAIKITVKDGDTVVTSKSYDVKIFYDNQNGYWNRYYNYIASAGVKDFRLVNFYLSTRVAGNDYVGARGATIDEMIIALPDVVEKITKITRENVYGNADDLTWSYDNSTNTLTVKNVHIDDQNKRANSGNASYSPGFSVYADIKDNATEGIHYGAKEMYAKGHFYDGEVFEYYDKTFYINSAEQKQYWVRVKGDTGINGVTVSGKEVYTLLKKRTDGYPSRLGTFGDEGFLCNIDTTEDQIVTWEFDPTHLDVVGVIFPIQLADKITVTSLTYIDNAGTEKTVTLNINIPKNASVYDGINYGEYAERVVYTNINDLKNRSTDVPSDAKYIKSITANCGNFKSGYSSRVAGQSSTAVGYIKQTDIDAKPTYSNYAQSNINYTVNGKTFTIVHNYAYGLGMDISARTVPNKSNVFAGEDISLTSYVRMNYGRNGTVVEEPDFVLVVPKNFTFNRNSVTAQYYDRSATGTDVTRDVVVEGPFTSGAATGNKYYILSVPGTVLSYFGENDNIQLRLDNNTPNGKRRFNQIVYNYTMSVDITSGSQDIDLSRYMLAGKRMLNGTKNYYNNSPISSIGFLQDIWDLNENKIFTESNTARSDGTGNIKVNEDKAIIVDGYLTQEAGSGAVAFYDPGIDGSSDDNAVTFSTGTKAQYHVIVKNTNTDTTNGGGKIEAYIPIPKATISGNNISPNNTGAGDLKVGESTAYQFNNYGWPMKLASRVVDPDTSRNYVITYWLGDVELDVNNKPKNNATNQYRTNANISDAELAQVSLVEIRSDDIPANYNLDGKKEFILELIVDIDASDANATGANGTKNIFRPYFSRQNQTGTLNASKKGNYVAAKLAVAELAGKAFYDKNGNGLFDTGDSALSGTKVSLYKVDAGVETLVSLPNSQNNPTTTKADGTYSFKDMGIGDYIIRFENTNAARGFSNTIADQDINYTVNSDATANADHTAADINVTLPYSGVANDAMLFLNAGYVEKLTVKFENNKPAKGNLSSTADQSVFKGHAVTLPTATPVSPYKFDVWKDSKGKEYKAGDPINEGTTLTAYWTNRVQFTNSNGSAGSISGNLDQQVSNGAKLTALPTHTPKANSGYSFAGWKLNGKVYTDDELKQQPINGDVTISAEWSALPRYTVTYTDGVDGEEVFKDVEHKDVLQGSATPAYDKNNPTATPTRKGYSFVKWTPDVAATVTANATYTATWKEETYTIKYEGVDNANNPNPVSYKISDTPKALSQPTKDYYDFLGWTGANGTTAQRNVTIPLGTTGNLTYKANWKPTDYTIDYDLAGGVAPSTPNPISYNVESAAIKLNNPTRNGYTFAGWTGTGLSAASTSVTIPNNSHGDRKYTATWSKNTYKLTYVWKDKAGDPVTVANHSNPATFTVDDLPLTFVAPSVNGYSFVSFDIPKLTASATLKDTTITGTFEPITYTINYVLGDGATNGTGNPKEYTIKSAAITLSDPSRPGYTFKNWKEGNTIPTGSTGDKTFTADWDTIDYKITYSYKDETNTSITQGVVNYNPDTYNAQDLPLTFNKKDVSLEGYTFEGFTPARLAAGTTGDQAVVGAFKAKLYTVKYNTDGGTAVAAKTNVKWNQADLAPALTASTKAGSTLKGWTYNDVDYDASETYGDLAANDGTTSITLKAKWEDKAFTVVYDTKGGTAISNKTVKWNDTGLTNGIPTLAGSTLDGWKIVGGPKDGQTYNNEAYKDLVANDSTSEIKLEAIWKAKTYRVVYDTDGGTKVADDKVTFNDKLDDTKVTTKKGFSFLGWFLEFLGVNNTNNKQYNQETYSTIVNGDDTEMSVTLYAGWKENIYTVHYLDKDGNTIASDNTVTFGTAPVTPGNTPEKEGHTFKGWFTDQKLTTAYNNQAYAKLVNDDDTVGQVTLYGKFDPVEFSVSFDGNKGEGIMDPIDVTYNDGTKAPNSGFSRRGYDFVSYNTKRDGTGDVIKVGQDISKLANKEGKNVTLYAQWQIINYKITYNWNDADPSVSKVKNKTNTTLFPDTYTVLDQITLGTPLRDGYTFKGWTPNNGKIEQNTIGDLTFTAAWEVINYDIVYDLNDANSVSKATNNPGNPDTYTIEDDITLLSPSRDGYTFKGWTPDNGKISKPSMGTKTFTATWEVIEYPITYNLNDAGSVSKATNNPANPATYTVEDEITLKDPTRNGYTFKAWTPTNKIAKNTTGPLTFTATWEAINYNIVYDLNDTTGSTKAVNDASNPTTYTIEQTVTPVAASRPGYTFVDWTPASVGPNATGTQTFVADWIANTYTIEFIGLDGTTVISSVPAIFDQTVKTKAPDAKSAGLEAELKAKKEDLEGWEDENTGIIYKPGDEINIPTGQNGKVQLKAVTVAFTYDVYAGDNQVWTKGSNDGLKFIFKRSRLDNLTYTNFVNNGEMVEVDGSAIAGFTASEGSLILELPASYLRACSATTHTVTVYFSDGGQASANFTVRNQPITPNPNPYNLPKTGVDNMPTNNVLSGLYLLGVLGLVTAIASKKK